LRKKFGNQRLMGLDYSCGGHLTHGYRMNVSARMFESHPYGVDKETGLLDYDAIEKQAMEVKPLILLTGFSAYPRKINFKRFREIADKCGAVLMVDMAHFAGLVAGKVLTDDYDPVKWADIVTTTTHKTLRGPRGALILCKQEFADYVNKGCPMVLGGPLGHIMAAKAIALKEANTPEYRAWAAQVVKNAQALAEGCKSHNIPLQTGGTDNHLMLCDVTVYGLTGKQAEAALFKCGVTANANALPYDKNGAWWTSGIRIGTPGLTTLGMNETDMKEVADIIDFVLKNTKPGLTKEGKPAKGKIEISDDTVASARERVNKLLGAHVLYPELDLEFLKKEFVK
ncbi:MAG: serine hydroxymethyltransferase, partial [Treponema sp.]|nr:serine hydroxymethyltransferase [Treponema sp.]